VGLGKFDTSQEPDAEVFKSFIASLEKLAQTVDALVEGATKFAQGAVVLLD
jgi:hypothetical protein